MKELTTDTGDPITIDVKNMIMDICGNLISVAILVFVTSRVSKDP
jgi:hypothetical protein